MQLTKTATLLFAFGITATLTACPDDDKDHVSAVVGSPVPVETVEPFPSPSGSVTPLPSVTPVATPSKGN